MEPILITVLFLIVTLGWICLPMLPALMELRLKTDAEPLQVVRRSDVDIRHFASGFREFLHNNFAVQLEECRRDGKPITGTLTDGTPFEVLPEGHERPQESPDKSAQATEQNLSISLGNRHVPGGKTYPLEIFCSGSLHAGPGASFRAVLAEQSLYMGKNCTAFRWIHAGSEIHAEQDCRLFGRVSANRLIHLGDRCSFERLNAPRIEFGKRGDTPRTEGGGALVDLENHPRLQDHSADRYLFNRKLEIPAGGRVEANIVVAGDLKIGDWAHIIGNLKAQGTLELGVGVRIEGSVISGHNLKLGEGCVLDGPVVAEHKAIIGEDCTFGSFEHPTTLSARGLKIGRGVVAHGTVWGGDS
ncbi:MAG: hypothetical protein KOO60_11330 [Gemmatimonadales bacterium]|nr:hypothetical protein [Gemmatimonadales bacterium]